ncbi:MAG: hypothetical protein R2789_03140 [Microthrixaceae bacterium]
MAVKPGPFLHVRRRPGVGQQRRLISRGHGSSTGTRLWVRCQPSAIARATPEASITRPVTADECTEASQTTTGATHLGSSAAFACSSASPMERSSVIRVSAVGAIAFTVTP